MLFLLAESLVFRTGGRDERKLGSFEKESQIMIEI